MNLLRQSQERLLAVEPARLPELLAALYAYLLLALFPLFFWGDYTNLTGAKFGFFVFICADCGLALLLALVWTRRFRPLSLWPQLGWPERLLVLFLLLAWVSALFSAYGRATLLGLGRYDGLLTLALLVLSALMVARLGSWRQGLLSVACGVILLLALIAFWQLAGGNPLGLYPDGYNYYDGGLRYTGFFLATIGNVDMLSTGLCLLLPLPLTLAWQQQGWRRWLALLAAAAGLALMLTMRVSSGLLALGVVLPLIILFLLPHRCRRPALLLLLLLTLALLAAVYCWGGSAPGTVGELHQLLHGQVRDEFGSSRVLIWREAWSQVADLPLLGSGPGTKSAHFTTVFSRYVPESGITLRAAVDSSHSEYLDYLLELGWGGLTLYLAALITTAGRALRLAWNGDRVALALGASVTCYCVQAVFNFSVIVISPLFWLLWGLLLARIRGNDTLFTKEEER